MIPKLADIRIRFKGKATIINERLGMVHLAVTFEEAASAFPFARIIPPPGGSKSTTKECIIFVNRMETFKEYNYGQQ